MRRVLTLTISLAITIFFLVLALYPVDFGKLARAFASADYFFVALAACSTLAGYLLRTMRWGGFLAHTKPIALPRLFPILIVGFALNNLLPGRPGEFARAYALGQRESISKTLSFATIVIERVFDGVALIGFLLLALAAFIPAGLSLPETAENIALGSSALFGVALVGLISLLLFRKRSLALFQLLTSRIPPRFGKRLDGMLVSFTEGLDSLRSPTRMLSVAALSVGVWACESTSYLLILTAFGVQPDLATRMLSAVFMMVLINLGIMIPAAPGGLGPFEAAAVFALGTFGVNETIAASAALAAHGMQYLLITSLGLLFVWREGFSLNLSRENVPG